MKRKNWKMLILKKELWTMTSEKGTSEKRTTLKRTDLEKGNSEKGLWTNNNYAKEKSEK